MRIMKQGILLGVLLATGLLASANARAQDADELMMPDQSSAKAKQIIDQAIDALGGEKYLNIHDVTCEGRLGTFDHSGQLTGFGHFIDYQIPPSKERQENLPKRNIIEVWNADKGWDLDRGGVSPMPRVDLADNMESEKKDIYNILRWRIHEPGMIFRYAGEDLVDLKPAQWVELTDSDNRIIRIAFADDTHLPIRKTAATRDPKTQIKGQEIEYFSNYHPIQGIQTAYQIARERNGIKIFQVFFDKCDYNTNVSDSLFTKDSLDQRWAQVGKKETAREQKEAQERKKTKQESDDSDDN